MQRSIDEARLIYSEPKGLRDLYKQYRLLQGATKTQATTDTMMVLAKMVNPAEKRPYLCDLRPKNHFEIGDEIVCYISPHFATADYTRLLADRVGTLLTGRVIGGWYHHDRRVNIKTDVPFYIDSKGVPGWLAAPLIERPEVLHRYEYEYLCNNPEFLEQWAQYAHQSYKNFDIDNFIRAVGMGV